MARLPSPSDNARPEDHIFISYSSKDRAFVDQLASELRQLGHTVWIDFEGIRGGERWKQSIADALHPSRVVLLILSPYSIVSEWVEEEVRTALNLDKPVIPILLRPLPDNIDSAVLKEVATEIHYRDFTGGFRQPFERLLGDLPEPKSGIPGHCQKLVAALSALPWGLDHYIQEEAKLLPLNASPYEEGIIKKQSTNLLRQLWNSERTIILGEPGVGKSVALERLAWELASRTTPRLPILIKLLEYDGQPLLEWVRLQLIKYGEIRLQDADETRRLLTDTPYDAYFLLDGLNEVRPQHRETLIGEITRLALEFPQHQLVVTSRVQDESWRTLRQGTAIHQTVVVQPIREEQAQRYLVAHLDSEANTLWTQLDERMRGLARTPLLLWLIKEAWQELRSTRLQNNIRMPDNRGELYHSFVKRLLRRDDERGIGQAVDATQRLDALKRLALALHAGQSLTLSRDRAETIAGQKNSVGAAGKRLSGW